MSKPSKARQPVALVYRSRCLSEGCPESLANLLVTSDSHFSVIYVGPREKTKLSEAVLANADLFAVGGGPDVESLYKELDGAGNAKNIRDFVSNGGIYIGICLGAYLAGTLPGLGLLPIGSQTDSEIEQEGAVVKDSRDTVIQVDWMDPHGPHAGQTRKGLWTYFQEGTVIEVPKTVTDVEVVATYSSNGDTAATISPYGQGWIGLSGVHLEADQSWYEGEDFVNPDDINLEYGHQLIEATFAKGYNMKGGTT